MFVHCWSKCKWCGYYGKQWEVPQKLNIESPYDLAIPLLSIHPEELKAESQKDICTLMFIAALFTIAREWKQPKCVSVDEWISKMWHMHIEKYYSTFKRNEVLTHATTWMNLEDIIERFSYALPRKKCQSATKLGSTELYWGLRTRARFSGPQSGAKGVARKQGIWQGFMHQILVGSPWGLGIGLLEQSGNPSLVVPLGLRLPGGYPRPSSQLY